MAKKLTVERSMDDFRAAYRAKRKLIDRQKEDFLFALGEQWSAEDAEKLRKAGMKPITDNRIAPNIYLLTGLERQNRSDFKAFPEGEEDSIKAEIATRLFKNAIKVSGFSYKSSDQFKDGITCGEKHLEPYLDNTESLINGKPCWRLLDGNQIFPAPGTREYDFSDAPYVYKVTLDISKEDLINIYPEKERTIRRAGEGKLDFETIGSSETNHRQLKDYPTNGGSDSGDDDDDGNFDLLERFYKKFVPVFYIVDKETGEITESENKEKAQAFLDDYQKQIFENQRGYEESINGLLNSHIQQMGPQAAMMTTDDHLQMLNQQGALPPPPPQQDPNRYSMIKRLVPEIWVFAHVPGIETPLADERAWFYPKWKTYHFVPYFARFSTAPLTGDESHLLVQGIVHGVKGVQEKHNKAEMIMLRHLNSSANSGWEVEEDQLVDKSKLENLGAYPGVVVERKKGTPPLTRLFPMPLSQGHAQIALESAEAIKAQLGINADLLATQEGSSQSGRAIALRQKQGLLMVQEVYDNLSRTRILAGRFLLSQLGAVYDTETSKKVLGEQWLNQTFPLPPQIDPATGQQVPAQIKNPRTGQPMQYDEQMAEVAIAEVLAGDLWKYDVSVGEAVTSETQRIADAQDVRDIAQAFPGIVPPQLIVEESQLPQSTKTRILTSMAQAQAMQQEAIRNAHPKSAGAGNQGAQ